MAENLKKLVSNLSKRGPHRVMVGDLTFAGLPGKIYAPAEGKGVPGIAFAHDWRSPIKDYHATLRHFASWGIAVAAPDTENGMTPNHRGLANDLESCLQILAGVKLGEGQVIVNPSKLGVAGHGMGAGCAVLAAAARDAVKGVGCIFPADTAPSAEDAATNVSAPGLILAPGEDQWLNRGNPYRLALNWTGDVVFHEVKDGTQAGFSETPLVQRALGFSKAESKQQELVRAALTGFLLYTVGDEKKYKEFADPEASIKGLINRDENYLRKQLPENKSLFS
ncbi:MULTISPECIES: dienelactone hydrolase family protein [unclassified Corynebacterium]|uniref:dienelactone hydrolase family protein n=1 Tax=unclassified Corynebacterium TaxID=2624378 RepID=UPI00309B7A18